MSTLVRLTLVSGLLLTLTPLGIAPRPGASAGEQPQGEEKGFRPVFNLPKPEAINWIFLGKGRWGIGPDDTISETATVLRAERSTKPADKP